MARGACIDRMKSKTAEKGKKNIETEAGALRRLLTGVGAVIFDLDGTLIDSMGMWKEIDEAYLGRFELLVPEGLQHEIGGMSFEETAVYFKERFPIADSLEQIKADWNEMALAWYDKRARLKAGAADFLFRCKRRGIAMGIATSNSRLLLSTALNALRIAPYFQAVKTGEDKLPGKPDPAIYLAVARELGKEPSECLVFEDIVAGIRAGKAAGMRVIAIDDVHSAEHREEKRALADLMLADFTPAAEVI